MNQPGNHIGARTTVAGLAAVLALTAALYWPGLHGNFLFDDYPNIVDNPAVHVGSMDWQDWKRAAESSPAHDLPRPLAMLSYAANYYFTGAAPWPMKLTNLSIHLVNGVLLFAVLQMLLQLWNRRRDSPLPDASVACGALAMTAAWLLCPINLSPVLYVVQRMESLAQTFVLAGLLLYLRGRQTMMSSDGGAALCGASLALGSLAGGLCKETAVLLPLYALLAEWAVLRFAATTRNSRYQLAGIYAALLLLPAIAGLAWLLPHALSAGGYAGRPFTLSQRLFTELRVVANYMAWTLAPLPQSLSFYHDDLGLSDGWLSPPSTLGCALLLAAMAASAAVLRRRLPLFALGIAWFFAAQLLTATFIPLELVFEHRNYFASIGLLLAVAAVLLEIPQESRLVPRTLAILGIGAFCGVTTIRAREWSDPIHFAYAEALQHPDSPRANYELGRTLAIYSGYRADSSLVEPAMQAFEKASELPGSDAAAPAGLIIVANHMHRSIRPEWWNRLSRKLSGQPPSTEDVGALESLAACQRKKECATETPQLLNAFLAALNHPSVSPRLLAAYGAFAANQLGDYAVAISAFGDAVASAPDVIGYRIDLARTLLLDDRRGEALQTLAQIHPADLDHLEMQQVDSLKNQIESAAAPGKS
jgi:tetratricopeptide (TPR) repeat protein